MSRKSIAIIVIITLVVLFVGCLSNNLPTGWTDATESTTSTTVSLPAPTPMVSTVSMSDPPESESPTTIPTASSDSVNYIDLYRPVINAYIELEQSGYTSYDDSILGDDVCLTPNGGGSYFISWDARPNLMYTFYNLSDYDIPELLIGAKLGEENGSSVLETGIYGLQNGKPVSLLQVGSWSQFIFCSDNSGNCIIEKITGTHVDNFTEAFYRIDNNGTLVELDKLYSYGENFDESSGEYTYSHTKNVNGEEVNITEQEYLALIQKYCSTGALYDTGDFMVNQILIDSWESLMAY